MRCSTYSVIVENVCVAHGMSIDYALMFIKAIMQEFYDDQMLQITIAREASLEGDRDA